MADLKEMTERVVDREKEAIRQEIEAKQNEVDAELEDTRQSLEVQRDQKKNAIDFEMKEKNQIQNNALANQQRNDILATKQSVIDNLLGEAETKLDNLDDSEFQQFVIDVVKQFENEDKIELIVGEKSKNKISQEWLDSQNFSNLKVVLSEQTEKNESGIIIKQGGIEYNFLFNELIKSLKPDIVSHITEELFN